MACRVPFFTFIIMSSFLLLLVWIHNISGSEIPCADLWDSSSTSTCTAMSSEINDNWCDCDGCEDEQYWSCSSCGSDACVGFCDVHTECKNNTFSYNIGIDCNFAFEASAGVIEGYCQQMETGSYMFECDNGDESGTITYWNYTNDCSGPSDYTKNAIIFSCGGSAHACDAYTISLNRYYNSLSCIGSPTDTYHVFIANLGCLDGTDYDVNTDGYEISYYFESASCDGEPSINSTTIISNVGQCMHQSKHASYEFVITKGIASYAQNKFNVNQSIIYLFVNSILVGFAFGFSF